MEKSIIEVLNYFSFFNYPPNFDEIYCFLKKKTSKQRLASILEKMEKKGLISTISNNKYQITNEFSITNGLKINNLGLFNNLNLRFNNSDGLPRYTLHQYVDKVKSYEKRLKRSLKKIQRILPYIKLFSLVPAIKLVGLSGSVAMLNADEDHDVDLFVITAKNRLWTARFIALFLAQLLGIRRERQDVIASLSEARARQSQKKGLLRRFTPRNDSGANKVCLNLFFDESNLKIPKFKQTEYVAHEVLQMKPLVDKDGTYMRFIDANRWVFDIFPNATRVIPRSEETRNLAKRISFFYASRQLAGRRISHFVRNDRLNDWFESILKKLQLNLINRHKTTELITDSQLWFHPDDFESHLQSGVNQFKAKGI